MRQLYLNAILLTFAFFWLNPAFAQSGLKNTQEYKIEKFLLPDGLRGNSVTCIVPVSYTHLTLPTKRIV